MEFKSANILIQTGLYFCHSVDIISPSYVMKIGENYSAHELAKILQASSKFYFILFFYLDDLHLQIIESISPKASVENSSIQWVIFY